MRPSEMLSTSSPRSSDGSTNAIDEPDCGPLASSANECSSTVLSIARFRRLTYISSAAS